jgi:hypothetical protein
MSNESVLEAPAFRVTLPGGEEHRIVADDEPTAKRLLREKLEIVRLPAGCKVEPWEKVLVETPDPAPAPRPAKRSSGRSPWKSLEGKERGEYLLSHITIPDRAHTTESRHDGESRADFVRRVYGLEDAS